jgi:hypothetical protein
MITLGNKVVMVRFNTDYPENSPKKWRVLVGEIFQEEETKLESFVETEGYLVDHVKSICEMTTWSGVVQNGWLKHHLLLMGEHFDIRVDDQGQLMAIVGTIKQEPTPVNPELELDAE